MLHRESLKNTKTRYPVELTYFLNRYTTVAMALGVLIFEIGLLTPNSRIVPQKISMVLNRTTKILVFPFFHTLSK